ncbi:hypothetical protein IPL68_00620 [Candidatus Saccharibacteria bacterium]|nr:MAG: hypothetical protein IPL68_00620 [Candidatus Saccharibacteria bacterium]
MFFTELRRLVATLALATMVAFATNWWAWHPSETSGLKTALTSDMSLNWATAGWSVLALIVMIWGVMDQRRWTTVLGYAALAVALTTGVFVTRGVTADIGLTMRMVSVALLGVALFVMAIWPSRPERDQVEVNGWGIAPRRSTGRLMRLRRSLKRVFSRMRARFRSWREDRRFDREQRRVQRAVAVPPPPSADHPVFGPAPAPARPAAAPAPAPVPTSPVVDHSSTPAAPASGSMTTSA